MNNFRWFRESTALICCQDKHHTTILKFLPHWPRPMTFDPLFNVLLVIFQLGTGQHSIRLEKMIIGCKFHILGIITTLGQYIAKNLPDYMSSCTHCNLLRFQSSCRYTQYVLIRQQHNWCQQAHTPWWRHQMITFSALLALCAGNSPVTGEFPAQRPVTRSFDVFFDLRLE